MSVVVSNENRRIKVSASRGEWTDYAAVFFSPIEGGEQLDKDVNELTMEELHKAIDAAVAMARESKPDNAMAAKAKNDVGGIDFNPDALNLQQQGQTIDFKFDNTIFQNIQPNSVNGIVPIIINITPITNYLPLLGLSDTDDTEESKLSQI